LNCTFDNGLCGWVQSTADQFNWSVEKDDTPSRSTGPSADHTTGIPGQGALLSTSYIEAILNDFGVSFAITCAGFGLSNTQSATTVKQQKANACNVENVEERL